MKQENEYKFRKTMYLENINSPEDVKRLSFENLNILADEIRHALLTKLSAHGGHIGPNLGMVEATIALHYVFNSPVDKIVYDIPTNLFSISTTGIESKS